ncbi:MAG: hypothetical protein GF384_04275 [Elusimicrobia bacterium]|nr:hypothetical protein [Elusimicrobiota bacterium]
MSIYRPKQFIVLICLMMLSVTTQSQDPLNHYDGVIHVHSVYSRGKHTLEELIQSAQARDIDIIIPTDTLVHRYEYGLWPLRQVPIITYEFASVFKSGLKEYLHELNTLSERYKSMVIIPGVEVTPFYYWEEHITKSRLVLNRANQDMIIIGLEDERDYRLMPVIGNTTVYRWSSLGLMPVLPAIIPYRRPRYSPYYEPRHLAKPYQDVIDYTRRKKACAFWAHPDGQDYQKLSTVPNITVVKEQYGDFLLKTEGYTGFSYFMNGRSTTGHVGGSWDNALTQLCDGLRSEPVWAIAERDLGLMAHAYDIDQCKTVFLLSACTRESVMAALQKGLCYGVLKTPEHEIVLERFEVTDGVHSAISGQTLFTRGIPRLLISATATDQKQHGVVLTAISRGTSVVNQRMIVPFSISLSLEDIMSDAHTYIRIVITEHEYSEVVSNPIFIRRQQE